MGGKGAVGRGRWEDGRERGSREREVGRWEGKGQ